MEVGKREIIYPSLHCHHQNDSCIKLGSDERHFNVSVESDGQSHKTVRQTTTFFLFFFFLFFFFLFFFLFEEKGEPKRYRTEVLPLTSLTPYPAARPNRFTFADCIFVLINSVLLNSLRVWILPQDKKNQKNPCIYIKPPLCHVYHKSI